MNKLRATLNTLGSSTLNGVEREDLDFYQTPSYATKTLIQNFYLNTANIWEPMAGNGAISKVLLSSGFNVYSSDIVQRKFKLNFIGDYFKSKPAELTELFEDFSIVTNPPYEFANEFLKYTLAEIQPRTCCVFLPIRYLEGQTRYKEIYSNYKPSKVLIYVKRLGCYTEQDVLEGNVNERGVGSAVAYMWLCFDRDNWYKQSTKTELSWIE